ncbi:hypothetical protein [Streptomyces sp. NRRL B-3648]|uniref:hypothetical protein n=1 Tax=Streptomyces sp. NRRL B-3648 TaxID=1519493 RepID=UPI0006AF447E|nr:hypothetical protein [Streptomyces sp. NRRL B-3648]KOX11560.1 hypothetical protein ADL04_01440 [Streptomyces sp. NRRL B-3648]
MAFGVIVVALAVYLVVVGPDKADKLASGISAVVALAALGAPYLLPPPLPGRVSMSDPDRVEDTGTARATGGGQANTGLRTPSDDRQAQVTRSGDATANGRGSVANTGINRQREP